MGQNIKSSQFNESSFLEFKNKLRKETSLLSRWFQKKIFDEQGRSLGLELETWIVDEDFRPLPKNDEFLLRMNHSQVVAELSQFNAELNASVHKLDADCLSRFHHHLKTMWQRMQAVTTEMGGHMLMIGSLPTLRDTDLTVQTMSNRDRYKALNKQIMELKAAKNMKIHIQGQDELLVYHQDVMMEAATTSMQIHLKTPAHQINRYFNASIIASAPLVALSANTPYLFGKSLWAESRIPAFEQAVNLPGFYDVNGQYINRVSFGDGYVRDSFLEFFLQNLDTYPVLLPIELEQNTERLPHLLLHHGTIWRWNRPIVGLTQNGVPHLRIEQRVCAAGPTISDMIAHMAFYTGLVQSLANQTTVVPESIISFDQARSNFYKAAEFGLEASLSWQDNKVYNIQDLCLNILLPMVREGLSDLGIQQSDIRTYVDDILVPRLRNGQNGTQWQRSYINTHGSDFQGLTKDYFKFQEQDIPVHLWTV